MIKIDRYFTKDKLLSVYDMFEWKTVDIKIMDMKSNKLIVDISNCEFPKHYSSNACNIIASKYFRMNIDGISSITKETSLKQVIHRMCDFWVLSLIDDQIIHKDDYEILYDELAYTMISQMWAPNSPQWFNTGLSTSYGLYGKKQGHWYYDINKKTCVESEDAYTRTQASACFILSLKDTMLGEDSLMENLSNETRIFKYGSGVGSNWSSIRANGEKLSSGGKSSGMMSFLKVADSNAGAIKSGGACLAPFQRVYTNNGAIRVDELANADSFIVLSYDPIDMLYKCKKARAYQSTTKEVFKLTTNMGIYYLSGDHRMMTDSRDYTNLIDLSIGDKLFDCDTFNSGGYIKISLKDYDNRSSYIHKMVYEDILNLRRGVYVDIIHKDTDGYNNSLDNLEMHPRSAVTDSVYLSQKELSAIKNIRHLKITTERYQDQDFPHDTPQHILGIESIGHMDVYDVEVICDTPNDSSKMDGHNFVIWPMDIDKYVGSGLCVHNSRRAAILRCLDIDHPDIEEFINWKYNEELKVRALGKMGYSTHFNDEAYSTVSGQNSNNSIRIIDSFMSSLGNDSSIDLRYRTTNGIAKSMKIDNLFDQIVSAGWECGDPGLQFHDTINLWNTCKIDEFNNKATINASNPCSEYMFLDNTACNLASINVLKFYDNETNKFNHENYVRLIGLITLVLEASIHYGQFPTSKIARNSHLYRSIGIGITNFASLLLCMGLPYDSDEARQIGATLVSLLTSTSYMTSSTMAEHSEPFDEYDRNKNHILDILKLHSKIAHGISHSNNDVEFQPISCQFAKDVKLAKSWEKTIDSVMEHGVRNAQVSVIAPTGTISFAMDCDTTSIEPFYSHVVYKTLSDGSIMKIVNPLISRALEKLDYSNDEITSILEYMDNHKGSIEDSPLKKEHYPIFDTASRNGDGTRYISPLGHIKMVSALSPNLSGAISKTINLPYECTKEDIKNIYTYAWKHGVKAISIYRDGCKASQPLVSAHNNNVKKELSDMTYQELLDMVKNPTIPPKLKRIKPVGIRPAQLHMCEFDNMKFYTTVSFYDDGRIAEVFTSGGSMGRAIKGLCESMSKMISEQIQYGIDPVKISKMLRGNVYEPNGFVFGHPFIGRVDSISDMLSKIIDISIGDYTYCQKKPVDYKLNIPTNHIDYESDEYSLSDEINYIAGKECPICHNTKLRRNGTCEVCDICGTTTGCS